MVRRGGEDYCLDSYLTELLETEKLNPAMRKSYQDAINRILSKVDSWIFFQTRVSFSEYRARIERVIQDFPGLIHL